MLDNLTKPHMVKYLKNIGEYVNDDKDANANTKWWVEEDSGVKFLDLSNINHTKRLHHFCFSSIKAEEDFVENCWKKCLDETNLIPAYQVVINDEEMFLDTLHFFKGFLSNTTDKENLTFDNKQSSPTCVSTQNPDCLSGCIITQNVAKESELFETQEALKTYNYHCVL